MSAEITPIPRIGDDAPDFTAITTHEERLHLAAC